MYEFEERLKLPVVATNLNICLVGAGGTGSWLAHRIARILWQIAPFEVYEKVFFSIMDGDSVAQANIGRQNFHAYDIGNNKAEALAFALSQLYAQHIFAIPSYWPQDRTYFPFRPSRRTSSSWLHLIVSCTDRFTGSIVDEYARYNPRYAIAQSIGNYAGSFEHNLFWLDCGNDLFSGQVLVGNYHGPLSKITFPEHRSPFCELVPGPRHQVPEIFRKKPPKHDTQPLEAGCAIQLQNGDQSLFINDIVASAAGTILYDLIVRRSLEMSSVYVNIDGSFAAQSTPITRNWLKQFKK